MKGYTGEACGECGNFALVRNGTCLKCDTCGGTNMFVTCPPDQYLGNLPR